MREILLIVWLLGYPVTEAIINKLNYGSYENKEKRFSKSVLGVGALLEAIIWVGVAVFIWFNF
jgi:hypothetical protein